MYAALSFVETSIYFITWLSGVFYAVYSLYLATNKYVNPDIFGDFEPGWAVIGLKKDNSDYEWATWIPFLLFMSPWLISHFIGAELIRRNNCMLLPVWYILISIIFLLNFVGSEATGFILLQIILLYLCIPFRSRLLLWILSTIMLLSYSTEHALDMLPLSETSRYLVHICAAWLLLRSLSFSFDSISAQNGMSVGSFIQYLSYCLYLPVLFLGPVILYSDFETGLKRPYKNWTLFRIVVAIFSILRYVFWAVVVEVTLHYIYFNALQVSPEVTEQMGNWALYGYGYCLGQYFMTKYTVIYGLASAIAHQEQIDAPPHPCCIARIHLYSHMWKNFDRGLYLFLVKYIYIPCLGKNPSFWRKLYASAISFVFVYVWHSTYLVIFLWSLLNFIGITVEGIARQIATLPVYQTWEKSTFSARGVRRYHALIATPLFMMSALSNFYFLGSYEIGNMFMSHFFGDSLQNNFLLFIFCYCCCQVSIEINNRETKKDNNNKYKGT